MHSASTLKELLKRFRQDLEAFNQKVRHLLVLFVLLVLVALVVLLASIVLLDIDLLRVLLSLLDLLRDPDRDLDFDFHPVVSSTPRFSASWTRFRCLPLWPNRPR